MALKEGHCWQWWCHGIFKIMKGISSWTGQQIFLVPISSGQKALPGRTDIYVIIFPHGTAINGQHFELGKATNEKSPNHSLVQYFCALEGQKRNHGRWVQERQSVSSNFKSRLMALHCWHGLNRHEGFMYLCLIERWERFCCCFMVKVCVRYAVLRTYTFSLDVHWIQIQRTCGKTTVHLRQTSIKHWRTMYRSYMASEVTPIGHATSVSLSWILGSLLALGTRKVHK